MTLRSRFFAMTYDRQIARAEKAGLRAYREGVLAGANGRVLEIGGGTGANLRFYGPAVESLTLTEPETPMLRRLERKVRTQAPAATVLRAPAEDLPFDDDTFDVAVSTLVLCGGTTSRGRCGSCAGCCVPAASCCSSSMCVPPTPSWLGSRTV